VNVIPTNTNIKNTFTKWEQYQDKPIPEDQHNRWKIQGHFKYGMAYISGKVWHRPDKVGQIFVHLDADTKKAIEELCTIKGKTISIQDMASKFLIEQHKDDLDRAHIGFYSPIPFVKKFNFFLNHHLMYFIFKIIMAIMPVPLSWLAVSLIV
jgi:hypothetical protein